MRIFLDKTVFDAALERIDWVFDEFENVIVDWSGGKDSVVLLHLARIVAERKGRLPLKVMWLDQEAEWASVVELTRETFAQDWIEPWWFQMPLQIFNGTSQRDVWLRCWEEGAEWMRVKEDGAITENVYGTMRFAPLFGAILRHHFPNEPACHLAGVRCEESPTRLVGLTTAPTYKHVTWGQKVDERRGHFTFYPLYDWSYTDIWKAIHDNAWPYCRIYDLQYQSGVPVRKMRVSNVHHECSLASLDYMQEVERETWNALTRRLGGTTVSKHMELIPRKLTLPRAFESWLEYRDYLTENLIQDEAHRAIFRAKWRSMAERYAGFPKWDDIHRQQVRSLLINDFEFVKLGNWEADANVAGWRRYQRGIRHRNDSKNRYLKGAL